MTAAELDDTGEALLASIERTLAELPHPGAPALRRVFRAAELATLPPGLYELHWRVGDDVALVAVGVNPDGSRWFAPTNWRREHVPSADWGLVERAVEIRAQGGGR